MSMISQCDYCLKKLKLDKLIQVGTYTSLVPHQDVCFDCWIDTANWADIHQPKYREQNPEYFQIHKPNQLKRVVLT